MRVRASLQLALAESISMDYFKVSIEGSLAEWQEVDGENVRFTDAFGVTVDNPIEPVRYLLRDWQRPSWAEPLPVVLGERVISKLRYMELFTETELVNIYTAARTYVSIEVWLAKFNAVKDDIDLDDPLVLIGLKKLEMAGLIGPGRALEICNA